jgi:hypothetical protein
MKASEQNSMIEPTLTGLGDGGCGAKIKADMNEKEESDSHDESDQQKSVERTRIGLDRMVTLRTETLRELNGEQVKERRNRAERSAMAGAVGSRASTTISVYSLASISPGT